MNRFTDNGDGTVTDGKTGLTWVKKPSASTMIWAEAMEFCQCLTLADYTDWRLPDRFELESLLDLSQHHPALPEGHPFQNVQSADYWSCSTFEYHKSHAWVVSMCYGFVSSYYKASYYYVWPVRGGKEE